MVNGHSAKEYMFQSGKPSLFFAFLRIHSRKPGNKSKPAKKAFPRLTAKIIFEALQQKLQPGLGLKPKMAVMLTLKGGFAYFQGNIKYDYRRAIDITNGLQKTGKATVIGWRWNYCLAEKDN